MWETIKGLLKSKKALVAFVTVFAYIAGRFGLGIDTDELVAALSPLFFYVIAQGVADNGKEAAKVGAAALEKLPGPPVNPI